MKFDMKAIGDRVRDARLFSANMSDTALAARVRITTTELRNIEFGTADPKLSTMFALADVLRVRVTWLIGEDS